ncbi:MAG TPA: hypothetical protein VLD39_07335 [Gammaproteobacteria bacterium]|nr:hypothetical protein [Gammaproteobacteria bacterium]
MARVVRIVAAAVLAGTAAAGSAGAQTLFTTEDFRNDREQWADPAYYHNNTVREMRNMDRAAVYGVEGTGKVGAVDLASPYPYTSAWQHYQAWLAAADGGTRHTSETIPDWRGRFVGGADRLDGGLNPASSVVPMLTPQYQEYFVQDMWALAQRRSWGANAFCLPGGFMTAVTDAEEFIATPDRVWILGAGNNMNYIRWIYTDDSGHSAADYQYPKWHGESIGFWDGDTLIVHTNQIRGWKGGLTEFTDRLETVERYRRVGDTIEGEITLYDDEVYVSPVYSKLSYERETDTRPELRPLFNTCTDSNGPASKVYMDERGFLNERLPGDPLYWDATDPRPWGTFMDVSEERYRRYRQSEGRDGN